MANLITNPDFEVDTSGWVAASGGTISRDTSAPLAGTGSLLVTTSASLTNSGVRTSRFNATALALYSLTALIKGTSGVTIRAEVDYYDSTGAIIDGQTHDIVLDGTTQSFSFNLTALPANTVQVNVIFKKVAAGATTFRIDTVVFDLTASGNVTVVAVPIGMGVVPVAPADIDETVVVARVGVGVALPAPSITTSSAGNQLVAVPAVGMMLKVATPGVEGQPVGSFLVSGYSETELSWIEAEPYGLFPADQDSFWGGLRKVFADYMETNLFKKLSTYWRNLEPKTVDDSDVVNWEIQFEIPVDESKSIGVRRNFVISHAERGAFTRARRARVIEVFLSTSIPGPLIQFTAAGIPFTEEGIPFYAGDFDPTSVYRVVEDIPNFAYEVQVLNTVDIDTAGLMRELKRITPAPIDDGITITSVSSL